MMDSEEAKIAISFTVAGMLIGFFLMLIFVVFPRMHDIGSGKNFIKGNSTYKCEKTNELKEDQ